jgi:hypothetical protein
MERLIISRPDLAGHCSSSFTVLSRALLKAGAFMRAPAVIAAMWLTTPAEAADIYTTQLLGTTIIHIDGVIQFSDEKKFAPLNYNYAVVWLASEGGNVYSAIEIGRMVWKRGYTTLVTREDYCASACTLIWLSGRKSAIQVRSALCFHEASDKTTGAAADEDVNSYIIAHLKSVGLTDKQAWMLTHAAPPRGLRCATEWWAHQLGFEWQAYLSYFSSASCSARWCEGKP